MPHDVFISYHGTANDKAAAEKVCGHLETEGFSCWIAPRDLLEGDDFGSGIVNAIQDCSVLVLIFSAAANGSKHIARELKLADDARKTVLPIRIEDVLPSGNFAYFLGAAHWLDAFGGIREEHLRRLVLSLRKRLGSGGEVHAKAMEATPVVDLPVLPASKSAVPSAGSETEHTEPVRPAVEVRRHPGIRWTGTSARYAYVAMALVAVGVIAWMQSGALPHPSSLGKPPDTKKEAVTDTSSGARVPETSGSLSQEIHLPEPKKSVKGSQAPGATAKPGTDSKIQSRVNLADGLTYVFIPPGKFMMGCSPGDSECFGDEKKPPEAVQIASGFWLGRTEVTQAAWAKVRAGNPSTFKGTQLPVENVDWIQAGDFCKIIGGRLPTEKEWEYAARAGTTGSLYGSLDAVAWYSGNSGNTTHPVALKQANAFGLFDMLGNVWEWTSDNYEDGHRVLRGGSWYSKSRGIRASVRDGSGPTPRGDVLGFRCVELR